MSVPSGSALTPSVDPSDGSAISRSSCPPWSYVAKREVARTSRATAIRSRVVPNASMTCSPSGTIVRHDWVCGDSHGAATIR